MTLYELEDRTSAAIANALHVESRLQDRAASEQRDLTSTEQTTLGDALRVAEGLKAQLKTKRGHANLMGEIEKATGGVGASITRGGTSASLGQQFINSETFEFLKRMRGQFPQGAWTSPSSELMAATLTQDSASGGALVLPQYLPGITPTATRPLTVAALLAQGTTDSNAVSYMKELAYTNLADTVLEGAAKPESTLTFQAVTDPVRKIAHWIPITEEMLEDVPALQSYLDIRLRLGVELALDDQLINGSVVAPDIIGFLARTGLAAAQARGADSNADAILKQLTAIRTSSGYEVDGIVMNPSNWQTILLTKDSTGNYYGGSGPFAAPHVPTLWGVPVAISQVIVANTCLVGAFKTAAMLFRRGGLRVESSNSHASYFVENKIAVRAELRAALTVQRPGAFGTVTGLT